MAAGPKARRAAALKAAKTQADRRAGIGPRPQTPLPPPPRALRPCCRRANTVGKDEDKREENKEEARRAL